MVVLSVLVGPSYAVKKLSTYHATHFWKGIAPIVPRLRAWRELSARPCYRAIAACEQLVDNCSLLVIAVNGGFAASLLTMSHIPGATREASPLLRRSVLRNPFEERSLHSNGDPIKLTIL